MSAARERAEEEADRLNQVMVMEVTEGWGGGEAAAIAEDYHYEAHLGADKRWRATLVRDA